MAISDLEITIIHVEAEKSLIIILKMNCHSKGKNRKLLSFFSTSARTSIPPQPQTMTEISFNIKQV